MPIDASIYRRQPVKSIADYENEYARQDANQLAVELNKQRLQQGDMMLKQAQREGDYKAQRLNFLRGMDPNLSTDDRIGKLRGSGYYDDADSIEKSWLERRKVESEISDKAGIGRERDGKIIDQTLIRYRKDLDLVNNPDAAAQWMQAQYSDPTIGQHMQSLGPLETSLANIPRDPQGFATWRQKAAVGMEKYIDQVRQQGVADETKRNNIQTDATSRFNNTQTNATSRENNAASVGATIRGQDISASTTIRGQNMTDSRAKEAAALTAAGAGKPLPGPALKMQQEALDAIGVAGSISSDLRALEKQIADGKLTFGPVSNFINRGRNMAGLSSEESRNLSSFKSSLERLRNESLRLNTGVQTDGDAQRAWNELLDNITDTDLVKQRLQEIQRINKRGVELQRLKVDSVRANYGKPPLETEAYAAQPAAVGAGTPPTTPQQQSGKDLGGGFRLN